MNTITKKSYADLANETGDWRLRAIGFEIAIEEAVAILTGTVMSISRRDEAVIVLNTALRKFAVDGGGEPT